MPSTTENRPPVTPLSRAGAATAFAALALSGVLGVVASSALHAQPTAPEDWPCVQVLRPTISAAAFWPEPIDASLSGSWRDDAPLAALAHRLGEAESVDEGIVAAIDEYIEVLPETAHRASLTRLADGTVSVAGERRARYIDGIRRYTRQQIAIAGQIESALNRLAAIDDAASRTSEERSEAVESGAVTGGAGDVAAERVAIQETLDWHERLYDQRERAIRALCERPVELEQRLSEVLRELAYRLPDS